MSTVRLVVFDWDGTLMDSQDRIVASMQHAAAQVGVDVPTTEAVCDIIGLGLREALDVLFPTLGSVGRDALVAAYREQFMERCTVPSALFPGARATLEALQARGHQLAVATGKGRQGLERVLHETGLAAFFAATRCADETASKPHPQMLVEIMAQLQVDPSQTLMVGDTEYDLRMARSAGVRGLAVTYGVHPRTRLAAHAPVGFIDTVDEIVAWLAQRA
jgi:phosphoglycolate phosphatase